MNAGIRNVWPISGCIRIQDILTLKGRANNSDIIPLTLSMIWVYQIHIVIEPLVKTISFGMALLGTIIPCYNFVLSQCFGFGYMCMFTSILYLHNVYLGNYICMDKEVTRPNLPLLFTLAFLDPQFIGQALNKARHLKASRFLQVSMLRPRQDLKGFSAWFD